MAIIDAVRTAGVIPNNAAQSVKKRYSERLSETLALEIAHGLRDLGFEGVRPLRGGPGEKTFQGGLTPKKVDVSYADEQNGLMLAVSIKSICFAPFGKNLKNRFGDLCTEAINLHMRFPYAVISGILAMPIDADEDMTRIRRISTFGRASSIFSTMTGRPDYSSAGERFESFVMMRFRPQTEVDGPVDARFFHAGGKEDLTEREYLEHIRDLYNVRNPQSPIGILDLLDED